MNDLNSIVAKGLNARPSGRSARAVSESLYTVAWKNASQQERKYLPIVRKRIDSGSLSEIIRKRVKKKAQKTDFREAVITVYLKLAESLMDNRPYF